LSLLVVVILHNDSECLVVGSWPAWETPQRFIHRRMSMNEALWFFPGWQVPVQGLGLGLGTVTAERLIELCCITVGCVFSPCPSTVYLWLQEKWSISLATV